MEFFKARSLSPYILNNCYNTVRNQKDNFNLELITYDISIEWNLLKFDWVSSSTCLPLRSVVAIVGLIEWIVSNVNSFVSFNFHCFLLILNLIYQKEKGFEI